MAAAWAGSYDGSNALAIAPQLAVHDFDCRAISESHGAHNGLGAVVVEEPDQIVVEIANGLPTSIPASPLSAVR